MLSKNTLKFIKSLQQKKFRKQELSFFVEGSKNVTELLDSDFEITHILYTQKFSEDFPNALKSFKFELHRMDPRLPENEAKNFLAEFIDNWIS